MGKQMISADGGEVQEIALQEALEERYLAYALSTIMNRALPDARDGLKPVHIGAFSTACDCCGSILAQRSRNRPRLSAT